MPSDQGLIYRKLSTWSRSFLAESKRTLQEAHLGGAGDRRRFDGLLRDLRHEENVSR